MVQRRLRRSGTLAVYWEDGALTVENYWRQSKAYVDQLEWAILKQLDNWQTIAEVERALDGLHPEAVLAGLSRLERDGFIIEEGSPDLHTESTIASLHTGQAARHFFFGSRNLTDSPTDYLPEVAEILAQEPLPNSFKCYPEARRITLSRTWEPANAPFEQVLLNRASIRDYADTPLPLAMLSQLLHLTYGQIGVEFHWGVGELPRKTSPSAGGRHPVEAYLVARNVADLSPGLYHYAARDHALEVLQEGDFSDLIGASLLSQPWYAVAPALLIMTLVLPRTLWAYRNDHAIRDSLLDLGHVGQTLYLVAGALGLGTVVASIALENILEPFLGVDGVTESITYVASLGFPKPASS